MNKLREIIFLPTKKVHYLKEIFQKILIYFIINIMDDQAKYDFNNLDDL